MKFIKNNLKILILTVSLSYNNNCSAQTAKSILTTKPVSFKIVEVSGQRPEFKAKINQYPVTFVIHSNASFYLQCSHRMADSANIQQRTHKDNFGITSAGKLSSLGRDSATVEALKIGDTIIKNVPASIFETAASFPNQGMVGLQWIKQTKLVIDFSKQVFFLNPDDNSIRNLKDNILRDGYISIPMIQDSVTQRYFVSIQINEINRNVIVSTVATTILDSGFAATAGIKMKNTGGSYGGPTGATGNTYSNITPLKIKLNKHSLQIDKVDIEDTYNYIGDKRPDNKSKENGGAIGADFMIKHKAIIDFGNCVLYIKI